MEDIPINDNSNMKVLKLFTVCIFTLLLFGACADKNEEPAVVSVAQSELNQEVVKSCEEIEYYFIPSEYYSDNLTMEEIYTFLFENHHIWAGGGFYYQLIFENNTRIGTHYHNDVYFPLTSEGTEIRLIPILGKLEEGTLDLHLIYAEMINGENRTLIYPDQFGKFGLTAKPNGVVEFAVPSNAYESEVRWHLHLESDDEYTTITFPGIKCKYKSEMRFVQLAKGQKYEDLK